MKRNRDSKMKSENHSEGQVGIKQVLTWMSIVAFSAFAACTARQDIEGTTRDTNPPALSGQGIPPAEPGQVVPPTTVRPQDPPPNEVPPPTDIPTDKRE